MSLLTNLKQKAQSRNFPALFLFLLLAVSFSACEDNSQQYFFDAEKQKELDEQTIRKYFRTNQEAGDFFVDTTLVQRTSTGLYYIIDEPGTGAQVKAGDQVDVHYIGWSIYNQKFDSSYDSGRSYSFRVDDFQAQTSPIRGWHEGLKLLKVGDKARLFIPSHLGYGQYGNRSIPPNSVLIFEVNVLNVK